MKTNETWKSGLDYAGTIREHDIRALAHRLIIPPPPPDSRQYQPASLDLTVGAIITPNTVVARDSEKKEVRLPPGGVATVLTFEELHMPIDFMGIAFAVNELSQRGLLVLNPGHIDPGYRGVLSVKLINLQKTDYTIRLGDPIFTVIFERIAREAEPYPGPYLNLQERINYIRGSVENTAPAALLDIHGDGLKHLLDRAVHEDFDRYQKKTLDLAKDYDEVQLKFLDTELNTFRKALSELEESAVKKVQLGKAALSELWAWVLGLIILGAAIAEMLNFVIALVRAGK